MGLCAEQQPPAGSVRTRALGGLGAGLAGDGPLSHGLVCRRVAPLDPGASSGRAARCPTRSATPSAWAGSRTLPRRCSHERPCGWRTSPTAGVIAERGPRTQQANTSWVTPSRRRTRVAGSRLRKTIWCRAPAPTACWHGRSASRARWRGCQRSPGSATSSAGTSQDSPITRWPATAAARAELLDTLRPCPAPHQHAAPSTRHEAVSWRHGHAPTAAWSRTSA